MNDSVLVAYAKAMRSAQRMESRLKLLFVLNNVLCGVSKAMTPLQDGDLEELLRPSNSDTMRDALRGVLRKVRELGLSSFPDKAVSALHQTIDTRNFLAHHYFLARTIHFKDASAVPVIIAELEGFSELFNLWTPTLDKWSDRLIRSLGITDDELNEFQVYARRPSSIGRRKT